jgi:hypothetical protein
MGHDSHTLESWNADLADYNPEDYKLMARDWEDPFVNPRLEITLGPKALVTVRDDLILTGSKTRFADLLFSRIKTSEVVYVAPRYGFAGISLCNLAEKWGKKLTLFMPACKRISEHQAVCIEQGALPVFRRVAAMPNLNAMAKEYALDNGAFFIPLGLRHPLVTAAIIKVATQLGERYGEPQEVWTAISTGVLSRALQIAWPLAKFYGVAVARNLHAGEKGRAFIHSSPLAFEQDAKIKPPFDSASNYDAKVWEYMQHYASPGAWFWNVAGNLTAQSASTFNIDSQREWGETR